jgi:hypothetical protein
MTAAMQQQFVPLLYIGHGETYLVKWYSAEEFMAWVNDPMSISLLL